MIPTSVLIDLVKGPWHGPSLADIDMGAGRERNRNQVTFTANKTTSQSSLALWRPRLQTSNLGKPSGPSP